MGKIRDYCRGLHPQGSLLWLLASSWCSCRLLSLAANGEVCWQQWKNRRHILAPRYFLRMTPNDRDPQINKNQLERVDWAGPGRVWATSEGLDLFQELAIESIVDIETFVGGDVVNLGGHRATRRIESTTKRTFYLKQSFRSSKGSVLSTWMRQGRRISSIESEAQNLILLQNLGVSCAKVIAYGTWFSGLVEKFSFLLTEEVRGAELVEYFGNRVDSLPRTRQQDTKVFASLLQLTVTLIESGIYFQDLVPKHIFMHQDEDGTLLASLIDVARVKQGRPKDHHLAAQMVAKLNVNVPLAAVGTGMRARFAKALAQCVKLDLLGPIIIASEDLLKRRRYRFMLSPKTRPEELKMSHVAANGVTWNKSMLRSLTEAGFDLKSSALPERLHQDGVPKFAAVEMTDTDAKMTVNLHSVLRGWVALAPLAGWRISSSGAESSWVIWSDTRVPTLEQTLVSASDEQLPQYGTHLSDAIRALLTVGVIPANDWFSWLRWCDSEVEIHPRPPFRTKDLNADKVVEELRDQLTIIVGESRTIRVLSGFSLHSPGLLGGKRGLIRS